MGEARGTGSFEDDIDVAEAMFRERWYAISDADASFILTTVLGMSDEQLRVHPQLLNAAVIAQSILRDDAPPGGDRASLLDHLAQVIDAGAAPALSPSDTATWYMLQMIAARWRGRLDTASSLSERLEGLPDPRSISARLRGDTSDITHPGQIALQRGITALLGARASDAMALFADSYRSGGSAPFQHFAGINAAANAAMVSAFEGHDAMADKWIARATPESELPNWCRDLITLGTTIATCVRATDVMDLEQARRSAAQLERAGDRFELWPFQLAAITAADLAQGQPVQAYARLKQVGFERGLVMSEVTIADHLVFRTYLDTLLAGGEGGLVLRLAEDMGNPLQSYIPVARTRLLANDLLGASRVAGQAMRRIRLPKRDIWEAAAVHAIANFRQGNTDVARRSITILTSGNPRMLPSIVSRYRAEDISEVFSLVGAEPPALEPTPQFDGGVSLVVLTAGERRVLQQLADGLSPAEIAVQDTKSEHTVRTQIKRVYRKLAVQNKGDAIARANHLGLLRWHHRDGVNAPR